MLDARMSVLYNRSYDSKFLFLSIKLLKWNYLCRLWILGSFYYCLTLTLTCSMVSGHPSARRNSAKWDKAFNWPLVSLSLLPPSLLRFWVKDVITWACFRLTNICAQACVCSHTHTHTHTHRFYSEWSHAFLLTCLKFYLGTYFKPVNRNLIK